MWFWFIVLMIVALVFGAAVAWTVAKWVIAFAILGFVLDVLNRLLERQQAGRG